LAGVPFLKICISTPRSTHPVGFLKHRPSVHRAAQGDPLDSLSTPETLGLETLGLEIRGLETLGLETLGMETLGLETLGPGTLGTGTLGLETLGLETLGMETIGKPGEKLLPHQLLPATEVSVRP